MRIAMPQWRESRLPISQSIATIDDYTWLTRMDNTLLLMLGKAHIVASLKICGLLLNRWNASASSGKSTSAVAKSCETQIDRGRSRSLLFFSKIKTLALSEGVHKEHRPMRLQVVRLGIFQTSKLLVVCQKWWHLLRSSLGLVLTLRC